MGKIQEHSTNKTTASSIEQILCYYTQCSTIAFIVYTGINNEFDIVTTFNLNLVLY